MGSHRAPNEPPPLLRQGGPDHDGGAHRGVLAGLCLTAARGSADPRIPPTSLDLRFGELPATLGSPDVVRLDALRVAVAMGGSDGDAVTGSVELAGHDVGPRVADLLELGRRRLPADTGAWTQPACWGCGADGPLQCRPLGGDVVVATCALDERATTQGHHVDAAVVAALVTCPATWLAAGRTTRHLVVRFFGHATTYEPLRLVARCEPGDPVTIRVALVGDDGAVVAVAASQHGP